MAANKVVFFPQIALTTSAANLYSPGTTTGGTNMPTDSGNATPGLYFIFRKIRVVNTTNTAINVALWKQVTIGSTPVAGKEVVWAGAATLLALNAGTGASVPANSFLESVELMRLDANAADKFLVGVASASGLTISAEGEIGVA